MKTAAVATAIQSKAITTRLPACCSIVHPDAWMCHVACAHYVEYMWYIAVKLNICDISMWNWCAASRAEQIRVLISACYMLDISILFPYVSIKSIIKLTVIMPLIPSTNQLPHVVLPYSLSSKCPTGKWLMTSHPQPWSLQFTHFRITGAVTNEDKWCYSSSWQDSFVTGHTQQ